MLRSDEMRWERESSIREREREREKRGEGRKKRALCPPLCGRCAQCGRGSAEWRRGVHSTAGTCVASHCVCVCVMIWWSMMMMMRCDMMMMLLLLVVVVVVVVVVVFHYSFFINQICFTFCCYCWYFKMCNCLMKEYSFFYCCERKIVLFLFG